MVKYSVCLLVFLLEGAPRCTGWLKFVREGMVLEGDGYLYFVAAIVPNQVPPGIRDVTRRAPLKDGIKAFTSCQSIVILFWSSHHPMPSHHHNNLSSPHPIIIQPLSSHHSIPFHSIFIFLSCFLR